MEYTPSPPTTSEDLLRYVYTELQNIAFTLRTRREFITFEVVYVEPPKPEEGTLIYADGTDWNPGGGRGFYEYRNATWAKL